MASTFFCFFLEAAWARSSGKKRFVDAFVYERFFDGFVMLRSCVLGALSRSLFVFVVVSRRSHTLKNLSYRIIHEVTSCFRR